MNLVQMLKESSRRFGEKAAVTHGERHLSYAALDAASDHFAAALRAAGISKGDRVAMLLGNSLEFVIGYFGIVRTGAVAVLLDPKYKSAELASLFQDCHPRVLISETAYLDSFSHQLEGLDNIETIVNIGLETRDRSVSFADFMSSGVIHDQPVHISENDLAHIAYTSGPSFNPHGVMAPHGHLMKEIEISAGSFMKGPSDVVVQFALPMHHVIGLVVVMLTSLYCGSRLIILDGVSIDSLTSTIERQRVSVFMGVPFIHAMLLRKVKEEGLKSALGSLRLCASAGDILPPMIVEQYKQLLNLRLVNFYGLTETLGHVTCEPLEGPSKTGSVGPALPGWKVKVVDSSGRELPAGKPGEIVIHGPMMTGYYAQPRLTVETLRSGWLYTGDRGMLDKDGYLYILGLQKDMLICKGQNIFPSDIEHVIAQHPAVCQVAAVGVPDEMRGEVVGAAVVFKKGAHASETSLLKFCLERLANYKVPKYFGFRDTLPLSADGKVDKAAVRQYFDKQAGADSRED